LAEIPTSATSATDDRRIVGLMFIEANKTLIELFEGKIKSKIAEVWGEL
jgi:hypothetical protein